MYIHWLGLLVMAALYAYLVVTDIRLHRRVQKLERTVRRLEGVAGNGDDRGGHRHKKDLYEHEDIT